MKNIQILNKIAKVGTDVFDREFYAVGDEIQNPDAILVRSAAMHDMTFGENLRAIARAGAGTNNIPVERCTKDGIVVFNTPGANANGVKELVLCGMLLASRDVVGGVEWVGENKGDPEISKTMEKAKSKFAGTEIAGKKLGVIGLGAIGGPLCNAARHLGMEVYGFDPYISIDAAWNLSRDVHHVKKLDELLRTCDFISLHTPLIDSDDPTVRTRGMIGTEAFAMMKDGVILLNFARDALVNDDALEAALASGKVRRYVTDFPNPRTANMAGVIATPHLGASTEESEDNCAVMAAKELVEFLETGNIRNSVNYPSVSMERSGDIRLCVFHTNTPSMLTQISGAISASGLNIENMNSRSRGEYAYTLVDTKGEVPDEALAKIRATEGILRITVLH